MENTSDSFMPRPLLFCLKSGRSVCYSVPDNNDGVTVQYKDSVFQKVKEWLKENGYPTLIEYQLSNGNTNKCKVVYQEVA